MISSGMIRANFKAVPEVRLTGEHLDPAQRRVLNSHYLLTKGRYSHGNRTQARTSRKR